MPNINNKIKQTKHIKNKVTVPSKNEKTKPNVFKTKPMQNSII